ncbi:hypothetical protein A0H81_08909 [Grifola frondosa]|uniref:PKS/mFAS DH domain-containing protein n=1 Tax=Grifola frondosa TaxID=5627 RepID=A0A1C7M2H3_GRIFR|nr:hypothetical protein A0H81_08909 [Grifola frondosa]
MCYWVTFEENARCCRARFDTPQPRFSLLNSCVGLPSAEGVDGVFETPFSLLADLVEGHNISGFALCPASVYHGLAAAGAQLTLEHLARMPADVVLDLAGITYSNSLVYSPDVASTVRTDITLNASGEMLTHLPSACTLQAANANRTAQASSTSEAARSVHRSLRLRARWSSRRQAVLNSRAAEIFYTCAAYDLVFSRIVAYSPIFRSMKSIAI